ncbi:copper resistance protein B [Thalassospiraceae bacterium LMO-SO8]|jgi:copper resistance protein B|nr:copper resistance protein B [Alphaproteobacteria bacterium LMO-S08]WND74454.1 copper resistance protein B [Thalassospiraceae bacterium LMO-SO8]
MKNFILMIAGGLAVSMTAFSPGGANAAGMDDDIYWHVQADQAEYRIGDGADVLAWQGNAWIGNDDHRLAFKTEGENPIGKRLEKAEFQFLYRKPISDFFDVNAGIRHDLRPDPDRTYGVIGIQGLAKQFVETDANLFVSETGDVSARFEAEVDWLITQRLVLQPLVEVDLAFSEDRRIHSGAGINTVEAGLRLKYEIRREFAPYIGLHYERKFGATANFARDEGEDTDALRFVAGVSFWF